MGFVKMGLPLIIVTVAACAPAEQPPYLEFAVLKGTPYERGVQHGERFSSKIRSLYTQMLTNSILPNLNREQPDIGQILLLYGPDGEKKYQDGKFSEQVLLDSALELQKSIPETYLEEMRGIADGADLSLEEILVLNTFFESVLTVRTAQLLIRHNAEPMITSFSVLDIDADGQDNDGDTDIDEAGEGLLDAYDPSPHALFVNVPTDAAVRVVFHDADGVDPSTVSIDVGDAIYAQGDAGVTMTELDTLPDEPKQLEVTLAPPGGFKSAAAITFHIQAGDRSWVTNPPPSHARFMRDQFVVIGTVGLNQQPYDVENRARANDRFQPPSIGFAACRNATIDGDIVAAHHFALLDAGTSHKHAAVIVYVPDESCACDVDCTPCACDATVACDPDCACDYDCTACGCDTTPSCDLSTPHATVGFTGMVWGVSGMNMSGLVWAGNVSDSIDNPLYAEVNERLVFAKLLAKGVPMGIMGREVLSRQSTVAGGLGTLSNMTQTLGWNFLLADAEREMAIAEVDANTRNSADGGFFAYNSDDLDDRGRFLASTSADDIRMAGHFQENTDDIDTSLEFGGFHFRIPPQRVWSPYYHRSQRAFYLLGDTLRAKQGRIDGDEATRILADLNFADQRDSMNASVYEPQSGRMRVAAGAVPATDEPFVDVDLEAGFAGKEIQP